MPYINHACIRFDIGWIFDISAGISKIIPPTSYTWSFVTICTWHVSLQPMAFVTTLILF